MPNITSFNSWLRNILSSKSTTINGTENIYIDDSGISKRTTLQNAVSYSVMNSLLQVWNDVSTLFTGILLNVIDTASSASSLLLDLQVNSVSKFKIEKTGNITGTNFSITPGASNGNLNIGPISGSGNTLIGIGGSTNLYPALKATSNTLQVRLADDSSETTVSALSYKISQNNIIFDDTTSRTLSSIDDGKIIYFTNTNNILVNTSNSLYVGFSCTFSQGNGTIKFANGIGTYLYSFNNFTNTAGQNAIVSIYVPIANTFILNGALTL